MGTRRGYFCGKGFASYEGAPYWGKGKNGKGTT